MSEHSLSIGTVLENDHRAIDQHFAAFAAKLASGRVDTEQLEAGATGLRRHIWVEEEIHFPPLREAGLMGPIMVMLREHGELWDLLDQLEDQAAKGADAADAQPVWDQIATLLEAHNLKEERILYPSGDQIIDEATAQDILSALDGDLPEGWTCEMSGRN